eukprot:g8978.t1
MNPLGMVVALLGAMDHAAALNPASQAEVTKFTVSCREAVYEAFRTGNGTRDLVGPNGLTTEKFEWVAKNLEARMAKEGPAEVFTGEEVQVTQAPSKKLRKRYQAVDEDAMKAFFDKFDTDANGTISFDEFVDMTLDLGIAPLKPEELKKEEQRDEVDAPSSCHYEPAPYGLRLRDAGGQSSGSEATGQQRRAHSHEIQDERCGGFRQSGLSGSPQAPQ